MECEISAVSRHIVLVSVGGYTRKIPSRGLQPGGALVGVPQSGRTRQSGRAKMFWREGSSARHMSANTWSSQSRPRPVDSSRRLEMSTRPSESTISSVLESRKKALFFFPNDASFLPACAIMLGTLSKQKLILPRLAGVVVEHSPLIYCGISPLCPYISALEIENSHD